MMSAPRSASSMPAQGPVMKVPCSRTRIPVSAGSMISTVLVGHEACGHIPIIGNGLPGGMRHDEADRSLLFLEQVRDQACGTRQQRYALEGLQRISGIQQHGRNGAGNV